MQMVKQSSQRLKPYLNRWIFLVALQMSQVPSLVPIRNVWVEQDTSLVSCVCFGGSFNSVFSGCFKHTSPR